MTNAEIQKTIDKINARIDEIQCNSRVDLSSSYFCNFDFQGDDITFERVDNETDEVLKTYTVSFSGLMDDEPEVEWENDYDGGYACWGRLNKEVKSIVVELNILNNYLDFCESLLEYS